ncbi:hypothetical protein AOLI_G00263340 [Acnodon oligacanthus]
MGLEEQTLEERIRNYSLKERIQTLKTFLEGLHYLHQQSIIHGDVKQKHVLVDTNGFAKLIDFKKSKRVENGDVKIQEEIQEAGKVAYYILSGGETYPQSDGDGSWTNKDITLNFIERMTHTDPTKRISLEDALRHPIFWSEIRKMRYLQAVGNFLEVEKDFAELLKDMDKYLKSPYPKDPCGLLQFIRNVYQHRAEVAPSMKFTSRFPDLFDTVYVFAEEMGWNSRHSLQNVFRECGSGGLWRLHEGALYLFGEAEGSCAEALNFCHQRGAAIAVITTKNQAWMESQAEGRKLWMNVLQDDPVTGLSTVTVHQCPEQQSSDPKRLNSTEERGCVCERRRGESPSSVRHRLVRAASSDGEDYEEYEDLESELDYDVLNLTEPETCLECDSPASSASSLLPVKICIITVSVLASLRPLRC